MGVYRERIYPRLYHYLSGAAVLDEMRAELISQAVGHVLEVGAGTGTNFLYYSDATTSLTTVEPNALMNQIARKRIRYLDFPVDQRQQRVEELSMKDGSFDTVVSTSTLCRVADPRDCLQQIQRVLKPGGKLIFIEPDLAAEERTRRWQQRLSPLTRRLLAGCVLDRPITKLIQTTGFVFDWTREQRLARAPLGLGVFVAGVAKATFD